MAVTLEELQIRFTAQMGGLTSQLNGVKQQLGGISTSAIKTQSAFSGLARYAKLFIGAFIGRALFQVGKESLAMANDVVESENLFRESMKGMSDEARSWSDSLSESLGLNAYELRKNAGTFNVMFKSMGLSKKQAYDMATSMTVLANDMASFYNLNTTEAFDKLRAGITGETEPLKRLGILVDENTVKQYAMSEGISKNSKELTQSEKLLARYAAIMAQTSTAQGDLARTIDSPANRLRVLNSQLDMAKIALGQAFQPIQAAVLPLLIALAKAATVAAQALAYLMGGLGMYGGAGSSAAKITGEGVGANEDLTDSLNESAKAYKGAGGAAKKAAKDAKVGLKAFDEINKLTEAEADKGGGGGVGKVEVPEIPDTGTYTSGLQVISEKVKAIAEALKGFWDKMKNSALGTIVGAAWKALESLWNNVIKPFGAWALEHPDVIGNVLGGIAVALATWEIGKMTSGGLAATNLGKGLLALGKAITAHPTIALAALVAGGISMIIGAINTNFQDQKMKDLAARFGDIKIGMEGLKSMAEKTRTPFLTAMTNLRAEYSAIESSASEIKQLALSASSIVFAYALTPEPMTDEQKVLVKSQIQSMIDLTFATLNQAKAFSAGAISLAFGEDGKKLIDIDAASWATIESELKRLGGELDKAVADYLLADDPTPEQAAAVAEYQNKIADLMVEATNAEKAMAEVRLYNLGKDFAGASLTSDTVKNFSKVLKDELAAQETDINSFIDEMMALQIQRARTAGRIKGTPQAVVDGLVTQIKTEWDHKRNIELSAAQLSVYAVYATGVAGQITKAFKGELDDAEKNVKLLGRDFAKEAMNELLNSGMSAAEIDTYEGQMAIGQRAEELYQAAMESAKMPTEEARANAKEMLELMKPTIDEWKVLEASLISKGEQVPEWLSEGLKDAEKMALIAAVPEAWASMIQNGVDGIHISPANLSLQGKAAIDAIVSAFNNGEIDVQTAAARIAKIMEDEIKGADLTANIQFVIEGLVKGITESPVVAKVKTAVETAATNVGTWFADILGIKSPSTVFTGYGEMLTAGLVKGINNGMGTITPAIDALANATSFNANVSGSYTTESGGISGAIEAGIERGVARVMGMLNINLVVDGERFGRASIKTINDVQRTSGRLLLEM